MVGRILRPVKDKCGFTLIELIVVIAVLGILATVAVPRVIGIRADAEEKRVQYAKVVIENALERYYAENGDYPSGTSWDDIDDELVGKYLKETPAGVKITYSHTAGDDEYELSCSAAD